MIAKAAGRASDAGVSCEVDAPADLTADVDPDPIGEAVRQLVDNALRFAPAGTAIHLCARATGSDLIIEVRDSGPGCPPHFLPHAFERFRCPDTGRARADGGAGLGLAIVSAIAHAHGGRVLARNLARRGAEVILEFPGAANPGMPSRGLHAPA